MSTVRPDLSNRADSDVRLPITVVPSAYSLDLEVDLDKEKFFGDVLISVDVLEVVDEIVCNAFQLEINDAYLIFPSDQPEAQTVDLNVLMLDDIERVAFRRSDGQAFAPGQYQLACTILGPLNHQMRGLYLSTATLPSGEVLKLASSQMQSTDARRVFPCWDEPAFKATFTIALTFEPHLMAVSNGPVVSDELLDNGKRQVEFGTTMPMSTYLVALCVGPFVATEPVDVDGVPLRVITVKGREHLTATALDIGEFSLRFFVDWFGRAYPADKLDLIAIPDFEAGAMENLGCVTFRETALLVDPSTASKADLQLVGDVVAHEIAHMWFGDLVTMHWWEGIWLNEAFATFCEILCVDAWRPAWKRWVTEASSKASSMVVDGLSSTRPIEFPVRLPSDAEAMFDVITYLKGGAVLRMLQQYLGEDQFRDGIRRYITTHEYANTVTTDLWDAIEATSGQPVRDLMDTWIYQKGHPAVSAVRQGDTLVLSQQRFAYLSDELTDDERAARWQVPVVVVEIDNHGSRTEQRTVLTGDSVSLDLSPTTVAVCINGGGSGYYRSVLSDDLAKAAVENLAHLTELERFAFVSDTWAAVLAGRAPVHQFVALRSLLAVERDPSVWAVLSSGLDVISRIPSVNLQALRDDIAQLVRPVAASLGTRRLDGEPERDGTLRELVWSVLGGLCQDADTIAWAKQARANWFADRTSLDGDLVEAVAAIVASHGDEASFAQSLQLAVMPVTPQDVMQELGAMCRYRQPELVQATLDHLWSAATRGQDMPYALTTMLQNRHNGVAAWEAISSRWNELRDKLAPNALARVFLSVHLLPAEMYGDVAAFLEAHRYPQADATISQGLERYRIHARLMTTDASGLF